MSILAGDIKLIASQVMEDVPEGGGAPTATVIADAVSNAIFQDISELDRAGGRVNMMKTFVGVQTNNREGYFGANVIVADPPDDPLVSVTVFSTGEVFDRRLGASSRVESFLNAGPEWPGFLYENHIEGQKSLQICTRVNVAPPPVGRTVLLRFDEGLTTQVEQYVRFTRVAAEERTFTDPGTGQDYQALIVTCDLSDELRSDFAGTSANKMFVRGSNKTILRDTVVANAANYYGASPLSAVAALGDDVLQVSSIYSQLVPNARTENSVLDQKASTNYLVSLATTPRVVQVGGAPLAQRIRIGQENRGFNYVTILSPLPAPGSARVTYRALGNNYSITDNGDGTMSGTGAGTINYLTGSVSVTLDALPDDRSAVVFYWGENTSYTNRAGQVGYRAPEFPFALDHTGVVPGSVSFTWTSNAVVKTATANAAGVISGDATGEVNHNAGLVFIRPNAMIDPGGQIEVDYTWSTVVEESHPGLTPDGSGLVNITLAQTPVAGSLELRWVTTRETSVTSGATSDESNSTKDSGASVALVSSGVAGYIGGAGALQKVVVKPYSSSTASSYATVSSQVAKNSVSVAHSLTDDGAGGFVNTLGTVSYGAKTVAVKVIRDYVETSYQQNHEKSQAWENLNSTVEALAGPITVTTGGGGAATAKGGAYGTTTQKEVYSSASMVVRYKTGTVTPTAATKTFTPPEVVIDIAPYTKDQIVPGSLRFTWMGTVYDDFEGKIYRGRTDLDPGIHSGNVNYSAGLVTMFDYIVSGSATSFTLNSMFTTKRPPSIANVTFATSAAPIKPSALVLSVIDNTGTQIIATSDLSGNLTGPHTKGKIDYDTGLVEVQFGDYVTDAGLTAAQKAEWWYSAGEVVASGPQAGKIWKPWAVNPETLRYNFVSFFYLPLDADILGLDPVRLPQDGRVPIFGPGKFIVVGNTQTTAPATAVNAGTVNCGRTRLSRVRVIGNDNLVINSGYTVNLDTGIVTWTNVTGFSQPVRVEHRVEDMAMVAEVQINGRMRLTRQLTHDYPTTGTYVSSALIAGDLRARVSLLFDQESFNNVWADAQTGNSATGTFNDIAHPVQVVNSGALTERWAIKFTNTTTFQVIGEHVGVIAVGNVAADCAPLNPASGTPYFTIPAAGWGTGWAIGNALRFNTVGAYYPVWVVRTIQQGPETVPDDSFTLLIRGDVDAP